MPSKEKKFPCFWCFAIPLGLYNSCIGMLHMRCLAIVFDLDETLIVANTMKSFEDRIELIRGWIARETDPMRISGMNAEMKRYIEDRLLLKQYTESDVVADNGKIYKAQLEEVPSSSDTHDKHIRPVIRLQEKNIVFTRINPEIRDTSVLVRLRPAWEELRSYLTTKGRKRFEVYVCTMAERDYALQMWRLLDPESHLINSNQLSNRIVCVKSGCKKSLLNVFQDGVCHPKMAMAFSGHDIQKQGLAPANHALEFGVSQNSVSSNNKGVHGEAGKMNLPPSHLSIEVLQEIGRRCSAKVEFRSVVSTSKDLLFSVEVLFTGEKIGVGMGKTRKDAQQKAAETALRNLAAE